MKIDKSNIKAIFEFSPNEYFLVYSLRDNKCADKEWSLNYRISRSEKGKDDDVGMSVIYLLDKEAEELKKYFSWIEL